MGDEDSGTGVGRYEWERLVRRARLGAPTKAVALAMATYADSDGSRVYPGVARLVAVTELSERSVHYAIKRLRDLGFIEQVRKGGRQGDGRAYTSTYCLTIPADYLSLPGVLGVDELDGLSLHGVQVDGESQPAPGASQPAPGASQPAPGAPHQQALPTTNQPTYQRDHHLDNVTTERADDISDEELIALNGRVGVRR